MILRRRGMGSSGFTLIEIVIVIAVLSLFCILLWTMLSGWMGTSVVGIWRQTASKELGTMAGTLRKDIDRASYPSAVTPEDTVVAAREDFFIKIFGEDAGGELPDWDGDEWNGFRVSMVGPGKSGALDTSEQPVLEIYQCRPGKTRVPGFPDSPVEATRVTYFLKDGERVKGHGKYCNAVKNLWVRTEKASIPADSFDPDSSTFSFSGGRTRKLVQGVNVILLGVAAASLSGDASEPTSSPAVKIKVLVVEPQKGKSKLSVTVTGAGQTGVKFGS